MTLPGARPVRAERGSKLTAKGWQQEGAIRMLQNNLDPENAERPDDLVVYGGTGKAARDWKSYDAIIRTLTTLNDDETMLPAELPFFVNMLLFLSLSISIYLACSGLSFVSQ